MSYVIVFAAGFLAGWQRDFLKRLVLWAFDQTLGRLIGRFIR